ncbi:MAG: endonuclease/exonuclease/phosphatase family protein [Pseudomonadota bacterium]
MPFYNDFRSASDHAQGDYPPIDPGMTPAEKLRTIDGLIRLRGQLDTLPQRKSEANLMMASWNLVSFGAGDYRTTEAMFYIAEMLSRFDLIALQEVKPSLRDLDRLMRMLGPNWAYQVNDATGGDDGNDERSAYIFNTHRVTPNGVAGEVSAWDALRDQIGVARTELKRPAYMTGFRTAWKEFALINLHLHPGEKDAEGTRPADRDVRQQEVRLLLATLAARMDALWTQNLVLVGDMNFYASEDQATIDLIHAAGFWESAGLVGQTTNITVNPNGGEAYDRMFFNGDTYFRIAQDANGMEQGGVLRLFDAVYRDQDWPSYRQLMSEKHGTPASGQRLLTDDAAAWRYYRDTFRKRQLSDHHLIWVELAIDDANAFLAERRVQVAAEAPIS